MSFSRENGYIPRTIEEIMDSLRQGVNERWNTSYSESTFNGTNLYKFYYSLAQEVQRGEIKASEVFAKLQGYIDHINAKISRPVNTPQGLIDRFDSEGFIASVKPISLVDRGLLNVCVILDPQEDDFDFKKKFVASVIAASTVGGVHTQGDQVEDITLTNGQTFKYRFHLPDYIPIKLRLTLTVSRNNRLLIGSQEQVRDKLIQNIAERYRLGKDFEPQAYFGTVDAPWASSTLLEYSTNGGGSWSGAIHNSAFDELFTFERGDVEIIES